MSNKNTSSSWVTMQRRARVMSYFHKENPGKPIQSTDGTEASFLTELLEKKDCCPAPEVPAPPPPTPQCPPISLESIATLAVEDDVSYWTLNTNTTILECQTLTIPENSVLIIQEGLTLVNDGTIINNFYINIYSGFFINNGTINHYGQFGLLSTGVFTNNGVLITINIDDNPTITLYGTILNTGTMIISGSGMGSDFNIYGQFTNNGLFYLINEGRTYNGGTIDNNGTFNVADGSSTCGTGQFTDESIFNGNPITNSCPP
jgi:hypothetical protein